MIWEDKSGSLAKQSKDTIPALSRRKNPRPSHCQIAEPTCDSPYLLPIHGLAESDIRTLKQIAAGMQKKQQRLDSILKQKSELEVELRKTQIELLQERSSK